MAQLKRTIRRIKKKLRGSYYQMRDAVRPTFSVDQLAGRLNRVIPQGLVFGCSEADQRAVDHFLNHRFNLLGSGWVEIFHGMTCNGFDGERIESVNTVEASRIPAAVDRLNRANRKAAVSILEMIPTSYRPLDWQLDFKSGYRWSESRWYKAIGHTSADGVDIKVPWELSRMQHLPEMAVAFHINRNQRLGEEFRNQVLHWIATNPPRFGVNWVCTMDVGIRIANWLIAYDLFIAAGVKFDQPFIEKFSASVRDHAVHIISNLEWAETTRANHYFGNIAGLLIAAIYLPSDTQTDAWLAFAIQELMVETQRQFLPDGGHFESSTNYHRLCAEIISVCAVFVEAVPVARIAGLVPSLSRCIKFSPGLNPATIARLKQNITECGRVLSQSFYETVLRAAQFTYDLTRPDGNVPQIGDNDSGRFVRINGWRNEMLTSGKSEVDQPYLNHQQWLGWASVLLNRPELIRKDRMQLHAPATAIAASLSPQTSFPYKLDDSRSGEIPGNAEIPVSNGPQAYNLKGQYIFPPTAALQETQCVSYPYFGVFIVQSEKVHLTIRCGAAVNDGLGVHAHEDQLSFELAVDNVSVTADPGSFIYTASRRLRNVYRSSLAHCAPSVLGESDNYLERNIFSGPVNRKGECLHFSRETFLGKTTVKGGEIFRKFIFTPGGIEIHDLYMLEPTFRPASKDLFVPASPVPFSKGYGIRLK